MHLIAAAAIALFSLLTPSKTWYAPDQAWTVNVKGTSAETRLVVTDFSGKPAQAAGKTDVTTDGDVDLRTMKIVAWGETRSATHTGATDDPNVQRVFLGKGQFNKLRAHLTWDPV